MVELSKISESLFSRIFDGFSISGSLRRDTNIKHKGF